MSSRQRLVRIEDFIEFALRPLHAACSAGRGVAALIAIAAVALAGLSVTRISPASAEDHATHHDHDGDHAGHNDHRGHLAASSAQRAPTITRARYSVPEVSMVADDGSTIDLAQELADSQPLFLNFIYTSCTTVCPLMTQIFSQLQEELSEHGIKARLVSVSIDPEHDTPARLKEYAGKFRIGTNWRFLNSTLDTSIKVQKAFDTYYLDKMSHQIVTFYRPTPGSPWMRIHGIVSPEELLRITGLKPAS